MTSTTFELPRNLVEEVKRLAEEQGAAYSDILRAAIQDFADFVNRYRFWLDDVMPELIRYEKMREEESRKYGIDSLSLKLTEDERRFFDWLSWETGRPKVTLMYYMLEKYLERLWFEKYLEHLWAPV